MAETGASSRKAPKAADSDLSLRVATYNIHKGVVRDLFGLRRVPRIHELRARLHDLQADLVFLQEVQGRHERNAQRFEHWPVEPQDQFLARSPTLKHSFEVAYGQNATYLHGHHGNALLSRFPIVGLENRDVSDHALEKRGILHCLVTLQGRQAHCFVVHFGLFARSRERQAQVLIDWIDREVAADAPLIIAGDFNDWRNQLSQRFAERLGVQEVFDVARPRGVTERVAHFVRDRSLSPGQEAQDRVARLPRMVRTARTYPALVPWLRMDRIYTRGFRISAAQVLRGPEWAQLSDHSPLVADLSLHP
ncbi:endonuclease/exonuclease/phosphatase family protein [Quisquiliibacterium transsilvanicum]|uniref:Endonuclease/exonuclease/phosphatase family metal-dependent hydrolase n=1 Tax=Quisquiliibacterium transsilvanicum TaxID=1549638 RepID=A0A7W8M902_9BURK|nr:endonuclease/exonuclease/phosphatase family protein [Quisquiliibacterium transsilvanicum]MBB5271810.1 endonuclease/exonuclease/phosphatase family metal-dependent hydrolase [Quisquiliibacterium transsilvanicum]